MDPRIHTVLIRSDQWELSLPIIDVGTDQQLELRFDDLSDERRNFGYRLVHCDWQWKRTPLSPQDYLEGFGDGRITEVTGSFNTSGHYTHYRLVFPEENCTPLISGNYAIVVYDQADPERAVLVQKFYVTEKTVQVEANVEQPSQTVLRDVAQQLKFSILHDDFTIRDPNSEVVVSLLQNNRPDKTHVITRPFAISPGKLDYSDPGTGLFMGGNEFRSVDLKNMRYQTENVARIDFINTAYHVYMHPDESRSNRPYFSRADLNGSFFIEKEKAIDKHTEADYVYVHFCLDLPPLYSGEMVYVTGGFCNWEANENNLMRYNSTNGHFECTLLLKQGLYDYCFFMEDPNSGQLNEYEQEGSFYETENDYTLLVYFHDRQGFDRLLGYLMIK
ncbi:MAG: DUF5103 domain-containing protein [Bacteroidales bacterium]|nr:DUF5103 domain-containing protein [Bacteroidales bacterium]